MPITEYQKRVAASRRVGLALSRRQQRELTQLLEDYADELSAAVRSGTATRSQVALQREVSGILRELQSDLHRSVIRHSQLQARTLAEMQAEATVRLVSGAGLATDAMEARLGAASTGIAQAVLARDGVTDTFVTLRKNTAAQAQHVLSLAALRGQDNSAIEKQLRLLVRGSEDIPPELLLDRRIIGKRTLEKYMGIDDPTSSDVALVRKLAGAVSRKARLISRTEIMNVEQEVRAVMGEASPVVLGYHWFLSFRHGDYDQCDVLAKSDFYEMGDGNYPHDALPARPHPRCLCGQTHILRPISEWGKEKKSGPDLKLNVRKEAKKRGLRRSQTDSLRGSIGVGESRRTVKVARRMVKIVPDPFQAIEVGAKLAIEVLDVGKATKYKLVDKALSAIGVDIGSWGNVFEGIGRGGKIADAYLSRIIRLAEMGAALRLGKRLFGVKAAPVGVGVDMGVLSGRRMMVGSVAEMSSTNKLFSVGRDGWRELFAPSKIPPLPGNSIDESLTAMNRWLMHERYEHLAAYRPDGKLIWLKQGTHSRVEVPTMMYPWLKGSHLTHNHPNWADRYDDARTHFSLPLSSDDVKLAMRVEAASITAGTPFRTFTMTPRKGSHWDHKLWMDGKSDAGKVLEWADGTPRVSAGVAVGRRYEKLRMGYDRHLRHQRFRDGDNWFWEGGHTRLEQYEVFGDIDDLVEALEAGNTRAVSSMQYEAIIREHVWRVIAEEYDWDFKVFDYDDLSLLTPHRELIEESLIRAHSRLYGLHNQMQSPPWLHYDEVGRLMRGAPTGPVAQWIKGGLRERTQQAWYTTSELAGRARLGIEDSFGTVGAWLDDLPIRARVEHMVRRSTLYSHNWTRTPQSMVRTLLVTLRDMTTLEPDDLLRAKTFLRAPSKWTELLHSLGMGPATGYFPEPRLIVEGPGSWAMEIFKSLEETLEETIGPILSARPVPNFVSGKIGGSFDLNFARIDEWLRTQLNESVFIMDRSGTVLAFRQGKRHSVRPSAGDNYLSRGNVMIHNHPSHLLPDTYSNADLSQFYKWEVGQGIVVTRHHFHILEPDTDGFSLQKWINGNLDEQYSALNDIAMRKVYADNVVIWDETARPRLSIEQAAIAITKEEAQLMASHEAMKEFAKRNGLRYRRVARANIAHGGHVAPLDPGAAALTTRRIGMDAGRRQRLENVRDAIAEEYRQTLLRNTTRGEGFVMISDNPRLLWLDEQIDELTALLDTDIWGINPYTDLPSLSIPRWTVREAADAAGDHARGRSILKAWMDKGYHSLDSTLRRMGFPATWGQSLGMAPEAMAETQNKVRSWMVAQVSRFKDEVLPDLRAMGLPMRPSELIEQFGESAERVMEPYFPWVTGRRLGYHIGRDFDVQEIGDYIARYREEWESFQRGGAFSAADQDALSLYNRQDGPLAYAFGAGNDAIPGVTRPYLKHVIQVELGGNVHDKLYVAAFWDEVFEAGQIQRITIDELTDKFVPIRLVDIDIDDAAGARALIGPSDEQTRALLAGAGGRFDVEIRRAAPDRFEVRLTPTGGETFNELRFISDKGVEYRTLMVRDEYLSVVDKGKIRPNAARLTQGWSEAVDEVVDVALPYPPDEIMWRGISAEEMAAIQATGEIRSKGVYNIGPEEAGATLFAKDPGSAASYAGSFAPNQFTPTFDRPAYIIAVSRTDDVLPSGEYLMVKGGIPVDQIRQVIEVRPYASTIGTLDLIQDSLTPVGQFRAGSAHFAQPRLLYRNLATTSSKLRQPVNVPTAIAGIKALEAPDLSLTEWDKALREVGSYFEAQPARISEIPSHLFEVPPGPYTRWARETIEKIREGKPWTPLAEFTDDDWITGIAQRLLDATDDPTLQRTLQRSLATTAALERTIAAHVAAGKTDDVIRTLAGQADLIDLRNIGYTLSSFSDDEVFRRAFRQAVWRRTDDPVEKFGVDYWWEMAGDQAAFEALLNDMTQIQRWQTMMEAAQRTQAESWVAGMTKHWAHSATGDKFAIATQFGIDNALGLKRSAKRHMSMRGLPSLDQFRQQLSTVFKEVEDKIQQRLRNVVHDRTRAVFVNQVFDEVERRIRIAGKGKYIDITELRLTLEEQWRDRYVQAILASDPVFGKTMDDYVRERVASWKQPPTDTAIPGWINELPPEGFAVANLPGVRDLLTGLPDEAVQELLDSGKWVMARNAAGQNALYPTQVIASLKTTADEIFEQLWVTTQNAISLAADVQKADDLVVRMAALTIERGAITDALKRNVKELRQARSKLGELTQRYGEPLDKWTLDMLSGLDEKEVLLQRIKERLEQIRDDVREKFGGSTYTSLEHLNAEVAALEESINKQIIWKRALEEGTPIAQLEIELGLSPGALDGFTMSLTEANVPASLKYRQVVILGEGRPLLVTSQNPIDKLAGVMPGSGTMLGDMIDFPPYLTAEGGPLTGPLLHHEQTRRRKWLAKMVVDIIDESFEPLALPLTGDVSLGAAGADYLARQKYVHLKVADELFSRWKKGQYNLLPEPGFRQQFLPWAVVKETVGDTKKELVKEARARSLVIAEDLVEKAQMVTIISERWWDELGDEVRKTLVSDLIDTEILDLTNKLDVKREIRKATFNSMRLRRVLANTEVSVTAFKQALADYIKDEHPEMSIEAIRRGIHTNVVVTDVKKYKAKLKEAKALIRTNLDEGEKIFTRNREAMTTTFGSMYENTQREIRFVGGRAAVSRQEARSFALGYAQWSSYDGIEWLDGEITYLTGKRGAAARLLRESDGATFREVVGTESTFAYSEITEPTTHLVLFRGMRPLNHVTESVADYFGRVRSVRFQPGNSFSWSPQQAANSFGSSGESARQGMLVVAHVPKDKIIAVPRTGMGCLDECEVIVLGGHMKTYNLIQGTDDLDWWEIMERLHTAGMLNSNDMEDWATYFNATFEERTRWIPDSEKARRFGFDVDESTYYNTGHPDLSQEAIDTLTQEAENAFETDWDHFEGWFDEMKDYSADEFDEYWDDFLSVSEDEIFDEAKIADWVGKETDDWKEYLKLKDENPDWSNKDVFEELSGYTNFLDSEKTDWLGNLDSDDFVNLSWWENSFIDYYQENYWESHLEYWFEAHADEHLGAAAGSFGYNPSDQWGIDPTNWIFDPDDFFPLGDPDQLKLPFD